MTIQVGDRVSWTRADRKQISGVVTDVRRRRCLVHPDGGAFVFGKTLNELRRLEER